MTGVVPLGLHQRKSVVAVAIDGQEVAEEEPPPIVKRMGMNITFMVGSVIF